MLTLPKPTSKIKLILFKILKHVRMTRHLIRGQMRIQQPAEEDGEREKQREKKAAVNPSTETGIVSSAMHIHEAEAAS